MGGLVGQAVFGVGAHLAEGLAVVGADDHSGVLRDAQLLQGGQQQAEVVVPVADRAVEAVDQVLEVGAGPDGVGHVVRHR